jgi:cytochrome c oxidase subunit 2
VAACAALAGCGAQSPLEPKSDASRQIATIWWVMLAASVVVFAGAVALLAMGWLRRERKGLPFVGEREGLSTALVVTFGMLIPAAALIPLFAWGNFTVLGATDAPDPGSTRLTVHVVAHQWWWEVRYPGARAVTANEIHIPARTPVNLVATTDDVIHSFWVPQLNRKIDMVPGKTNRILLDADEPGRFRGQCAEFCGLQHVHMGFFVQADTPARFRAWLERMAEPRRAPTTAQQKQGEQVFLDEACSGCHTIRGTSARGDVGPDLTHLQSRTTLAGLTIPNRAAYLRQWVRDPQHVKPGNKMPAIGLDRRELGALIDYLESLR